jgi:SAM-dependent methyltransferase
MNRSDWIKAMRGEAEKSYDTLWAPTYGEKFGIYDNAAQLRFIQSFLRLLPQPGTLLDAACGAGRYFPLLLEKGHTVVGIDQSAGMLGRAREKFPGVRLEKIGLQELSYREAFEGAICMDAMEHVFPEDWPAVLGNLQRALKPQGVLYFTVEIAAEAEIEQAFLRGKQMGLPVVHGEWADQEVYHYYPPLLQVREWLRSAGFDPLEEGEGSGYRHFIVRKGTADGS